jgi:pimeloyl-ACP methyl ester carboxylesterase
MNSSETVETTLRSGSEAIHALTRGSGPKLLVLHDEMGYPGPLGWEADLARERQLIIPLAPGFGRAPRVEWVGNVRDLASLYARMLRSERLAPIDVIGFSFGGWLAAEMAASDPSLFRRVVLVAPLGIRPDVGEILDAFALSHRAQLDATVADPAGTPEFAKLYENVAGASAPEQMISFDDARAETARLAWQPYLHDTSLPHRLEGLGERLPILLVHGEADAVVPRSAIDRYAHALGAARIESLPRCGHRPEIERREAFSNLVRKFLA